MRTTLTLDDELAAALREAAHESGRPFRAVVNETLRAGLTASGRRPRPRRYRVEPASLGGALPGVDLDRTLALADRLEEAALADKLAQRK